MLRVAILAAVCLVAAVSAAEHVSVLTTANFDEKLAAAPIALVEFYAPWCGHCKRLEPEYEKAAEELKSETDILLAKVDATVEEKLGQKFNVQGFPTILLFRDGADPTPYEGGRTSRDIVSFLKKQKGPAVKKLADAAELTAAKPQEEAGEPIIVAFAKDGSETAQFFSKFANKNRNDFAFYQIDSTVEGETDGTIVLYKPYDELRAVFDGPQEDDAFRSWAKGQSLRLVDQIGPENYRAYVDRKLPILWLFLDPSQEEIKNQQLEQYKQVAPEFRELSFVWLNGVQYGQMLSKLGVSGMPSLAIETPDGDKFPFPGKDITAEAVRDWLGQYKSGSLSAHTRSEEDPANPTDEDNVYILTGNNFKDIALDTNADVLVEFYAPWCGHCKSLTPIYGALATSLKGVDGIKIAKIDATANDVPKQFAVQGFPTIKLVKAGSNEVVDYNGARTESAFLDFLKSSAANGSNIDKKEDKQDNKDEL